MSQLTVFNKDTLVGTCCFNGSLFVKYLDESGSVRYSHHIPECPYEVFCIYRSTPSLRDCFQSTIRMTRVCLETTVGFPETNKHLFNTSPREDPRVAAMNDKLIMSYSHVVDNRDRKNLHIRIKAEIYDDEIGLDKSRQTVDFQLNNSSRTQKNWTFFEESGCVHILYNIMPFQVFLWDVDANLTDLTNSHVPLIHRAWSHPTKPDLKLRGGTQPIRIGNLYYVFVHSIDYELYCVTFNAHNFDVLSVTKGPLIPNRGNKKDIHFPCGVLYDPVKEMFHVSLGIDDVKLGLFQIDKSLLDDNMISVDNSNSVIIKDRDFSNIITKERSLWVNSYGGCGNDMLVLILKRKGYRVYSDLWDKIGCHYLLPQSSQKKCLYMIVHPGVALASMRRNKTLSTNFRKLSNQTDIQAYTMTGLIYFMRKQSNLWLESSNALVVHGQNVIASSENIENYFQLPNGLLKDYPLADPYISDDVASVEQLMTTEPFICKRLYNECLTLFEKFFPHQDSKVSHANFPPAQDHIHSHSENCR